MPRRPPDDFTWKKQALEQTLCALGKLRVVHRSGSPSSEECIDALKRVRGSLKSVKVRVIVQRPLEDVDGSSALDWGDSKQLLRTEADLVRPYGKSTDSLALRRAFKNAIRNEVAEWFRSSDALAEYIVRSHDELCEAFTDRWWDPLDISNTGARRRFDRAVLSVVVILVDVIKGEAYLTQSYRLAHALAEGRQ